MEAEKGAGSPIGIGGGGIGLGERASGKLKEKQHRTTMLMSCTHLRNPGLQSALCRPIATNPRASLLSKVTVSLLCLLPVL